MEGGRMIDIAGRIREFIARDMQLGEDATKDLSDTSPLLEGGVLDSLGLMDLVAYLEKEFGIEIADDDIRVDNFRTVADVARLVERLNGEQPDQVTSSPIV
jgi:acyl carrier protein